MSESILCSACVGEARLVALLDAVVGRDHLEREQAAASHPEADRADAPVLHAIDLGADRGVIG